MDETSTFLWFELPRVAGYSFYIFTWFHFHKRKGYFIPILWYSLLIFIFNHFGLEFLCIQFLWILSNTNRPRMFKSGEGIWYHNLLGHPLCCGCSSLVKEVCNHFTHFRCKNFHMKWPHLQKILRPHLRGDVYMSASKHVYA